MGKSRKNLHLSSLVSFLFPSIPQGLSVTPLSAVIKHHRLVFLVISGHLQIVPVTLKKKHTHQPIKESRLATITHTDISKADVRNTVFLILLGWEYTSNTVDFSAGNTVLFNSFQGKDHYLAYRESERQNLPPTCLLQKKTSLN